MTHPASDHDPHKSTIPCTDGFRRARSVGLWTAPTSSQLVLVAPPAEAALLTPAQARELGRRLVALATVCEQQHAELERAGQDGQPRTGVA